MRREIKLTLMLTEDYSQMPQRELEDNLREALEEGFGWAMRDLKVEVVED